MANSHWINWLRLLRRQARADSLGGVRIKTRSIYIMPTRQGLLLVFVILLMLVGSINYGSNLGHLATFLLFGIWLAALLHTWRNLLGLRVQPYNVLPVFASEVADFILLINNASTIPRYGIGIKHRKIQGERIDIPAEEQVQIHLPLPTQKRGVFPLPQVTIYTNYPLGLFHAWTYAWLDLSCLVYPKPAQQGTPPVTTSYQCSDEGDRGVGTDDFMGLRHFHMGDSVKHIDWKVYARQQELLCKQFGGDRHIEVKLDWDLLPEQNPERRLSLLCRYILQQEALERAYSLRIPGVSIPSGMGSNHMQRCLSALARYGGTSTN
jgi:uncharacterized protein (DUF58 family)